MRLGTVASGSFLVLLATSGTWGCGLLGPSCLERQKRGTVASIQGEVAAGEMTWHLVAYGSEGSQNNVEVSWPGQEAADGPRLAAYATRAECADFEVPVSHNSGSCTVLGAAGWVGGHTAMELIIANGRGNPDILGSPPQFKLWVVGDPARDISYSVRVTWFYGPDC